MRIWRNGSRAALRTQCPSDVGVRLSLSARMKYTKERLEEAVKARREYNNAFNKAKYYRRRAEAIAYLGGKCIDCNSTSGLEFDHRNPEEKSFNVSGKLHHSWEKIKAELDKCDLRCVACHMHMTAFQRLQSVDVLGVLD